ncbi:acyl-CoA thioesterase [Egbenema bharatensis]|uniref:acyl-CoA thioesterase n=1 Tax=Egbenema bharatensis TaxID=3463334 RepID=UPI003A88AB37
MKPQLEPTRAIQTHFEQGADQTIEQWFEYPVRAQPHHTDYGGIVWHGSYIAWMEEARVECFRSLGVDYADMVAVGCELQVVNLSIRYHRPVRLGMPAIVKARIAEMKGVRVNWDYRIQSPDDQELFVTAQVTLVGVDSERGKIMRRLPAMVQDVLAKLSSQAG